MNPILICILAVFFIWVIWAFNRFVSLVTRVQAAWADIDVQLKRRYDLIPNLVSTVKGYAAHESRLFEKVTTARSAAMSAGTVRDHAAAENTLAESVRTLFAVSEAYPELKANENFLALQRTLSEIENTVQFARRFYNGTVRNLNTATGRFPGIIIARLFGFRSRDFFDIVGKDGEDPILVRF